MTYGATKEQVVSPGAKFIDTGVSAELVHARVDG
jgi:hypothetical protein